MTKEQLNDIFTTHCVGFVKNNNGEFDAIYDKKEIINDILNAINNPTDAHSKSYSPPVNSEIENNLKNYLHNNLG